MAAVHHAGAAIMDDLFVVNVGGVWLPSSCSLSLYALSATPCRI
jgi:hypothetical protein